MIATTVSIHVKEECLAEFIAATIENHKGSIMEVGNIRFDVLQTEEDPTRFLLYEVFESKEAIAFHRTTPHYLKWRETVEPFMASPRVGVPHKILEPLDAHQW